MIHRVWSEGVLPVGGGGVLARAYAVRAYADARGWCGRWQPATSVQAMAQSRRSQSANSRLDSSGRAMSMLRSRRLRVSGGDV